MTRRRNHGAALVTALATVIVVGSVGVALTSHTLSSVSSMQLDRSATRARLAAEGGIEAARAALRRDPSWTGGTVRVGGLDVVVTVAEGTGDAEGDAGPAGTAGSAGTAGTARTIGGPGALVRAVSRAPGSVIEAVLRRGPGLPSICEWTER